MEQNSYSGRSFETSPCTGFCFCSLLSNGLSADLSSLLRLDRLTVIDAILTR
jgi:hypothetical protein